MFYIATITDKHNAPAVRKQLRAAGFSYVRPLKEWVAFAQTPRAELSILSAAHQIHGIEFYERTNESHSSTIAAYPSIAA